MLPAEVQPHVAEAAAIMTMVIAAVAFVTSENKWLGCAGAIFIIVVGGLLTLALAASAR